MCLIRRSIDDLLSFCVRHIVVQPSNTHPGTTKVPRKLVSTAVRKWDKKFQRLGLKYFSAQLISNISDETPPHLPPDAFATLTQRAPSPSPLGPSSAQLQFKTKMQTRSGSRSVSAGTSSSENHPLPLNSGREMSDITQGAQDDASNTVTRLSSPAARMPSPHPTHDQSASMAPAPVSLDFLAQSYRTGEYSDLEIVSNGVERSVHKVIVCSQSPVIKRKCSLVSPHWHVLTFVRAD